MRKLFKLNELQDISIPISHPIYKDVLAAIIIGHSIVPIVKGSLVSLNYRYENIPFQGEMWYQPRKHISSIIYLY